MFSKVEKAYKRGLLEHRFWHFYIWRAALAVIIGLAFIIGLGFSGLLVSGVVVVLLLLFVLQFFWQDLRRTVGKLPGQTVKEKLIIYFEYDEHMRRDTLLHALAEQNIQTKDDLKLILSYFRSRQPAKTKPNILQWFVSVLVALISVVVLAYDGNTHAIDVEKLTIVTKVTIDYALVVLTPVLVIVLTRAWLQVHRVKVESILLDDLAYIYINFDELSDRLIV